MTELKKIYSASVKAARDKANKTVRETQKAYDLLKNKESDYAFIIKNVLDLYIESADVYNSAPSEILFDHEAF
jgi:hypothetical protein